MPDSRQALGGVGTVVAIDRPASSTAQVATSTGLGPVEAVDPPPQAGFGRAVAEFAQQGESL